MATPEWWERWRALKLYLKKHDAVLEAVWEEYEKISPMELEQQNGLPEVPVPPNFALPAEENRWRSTYTAFFRIGYSLEEIEELVQARERGELLTQVRLKPGLKEEAVRVLLPRPDRDLIENIVRIRRYSQARDSRLGQRLREEGVSQAQANRRRGSKSPLYRAFDNILTDWIAAGGEEPSPVEFEEIAKRKFSGVGYAIGDEWVRVTDEGWVTAGASEFKVDKLRERIYEWRRHRE